MNRVRVVGAAGRAGFPSSIHTSSFKIEYGGLSFASKTVSAPRTLVYLFLQIYVDLYDSFLDLKSYINPNLLETLFHNNKDYNVPMIPQDND